MTSDAPSGKPPTILILLAAGSMLVIALLLVAIVADPMRRFALTLPTAADTPTAVRVVVDLPTDVPTVTLVPPTSTPVTPTVTPTPTSTPTITPTVPTATPVTPTVTPTRTRRPKPTVVVRRCVAVVGDSVAHGDAVFEIPGIGFLQAQMLPVSAFIDLQYRQRGVSNVQVFNRSSSAVGISSANHPSYFNTFEYAQLLQDGCQYTVIIPWVNDLSSGMDASAAAPVHVTALATLAQAVIARNPNGKILIVNYYQGAAAPFALSSFASGFTPGNVAAFNAQISAACAGGALALPQIRCVDSSPAFVDIGLSHLIGPVTKQDLDALLTAPPSPDQANQVSFYFGSNPGGSLIGDGVHLSNPGKARLAAYLVDLMP